MRTPARPTTVRNLPNLLKSFLPTTFHPPVSDPPFNSLPGGGTASSATQMLRSKDVLFQRAGVTRLRAVLASPGGASLVADAIDSHGCAEALVRVAIAFRDESVRERKRWGLRGWWGRKRGGGAEGVAEGGAARVRASRREARRDVARDAGATLESLAAIAVVARAMNARPELVASLRDASRDGGLDEAVRESARRAHASLAAAAAETGGDA